MLGDARILAGVLCGFTACGAAAQMPYPWRPQVGPPEPPPITDKEIVGTWVGTTVCRGVGPRLATGLRLTIELDYVSVDSCKTHVCEHTMVSGVFERFPLGQAGGAVPQTVRVRGMLAGRGVLLERFGRALGPHVPVLNGDVSIDGATFSGADEGCGEFSLRKRI